MATKIDRYKTKLASTMTKISKVRTLYDFIIQGKIGVDNTTDLVSASSRTGFNAAAVQAALQSAIKVLRIKEIEY